MRMRYAALAATLALVAALAATILLTSAIGLRPASAAQQTVPHSLAPAPDTPVTPLPTYTLTVTAAPGGNVDPAGATTHDEASEVTLTANWNDATHTFGGWSGNCSGSDTTCTLEMYANASVTAAFTPLPADRCTSPTDANCIRAVYKGAPDDYAQVQDIPAELLLAPDADGRYRVRRGEQITVVTAAHLPTGYTRFYLQRSPQVRPSPTSHEQLIQPVGTTYTFTSITFEGGASLLTFDLTAARPLPVQRPGIKPELGDVVVTTTFDVLTPPPAVTPVEVPMSAYNAEALPPGTYQFPALRSGQRPLIIQIPTTNHQIKWQEIIFSDPGGVSFCLSDLAGTSALCLAQADGGEVYRGIPDTSPTDASVTISDVFDYIAASATVEGTTGSQVKSDTLRYRSYDVSGAVATPGSYAFLIDSSVGATVVATFEGLRDGTATALLIHKSDAYGASQAQVYDAILAGDLFEWRHADDCWVRYTVTEVKPDPTGIVPRKLLAVEWMTYAFSGCSGAVSTNVAASIAWGTLPDVGGTKLMVPIRHGSFQIVPKGWTGTIERDPLRQWPGNSFENPVTTTDLSAAQQLPTGSTQSCRQTGRSWLPPAGIRRATRHTDTALDGTQRETPEEFRSVGASWRHWTGRLVLQARMAGSLRKPASSLVAQPSSVSALRDRNICALHKLKFGSTMRQAALRITSEASTGH